MNWSGFTFVAMDIIYLLLFCVSYKAKLGH